MRGFGEKRRKGLPRQQRNSSSRGKSTPCPMMREAADRALWGGERREIRSGGGAWKS